MVEGSSPSVGVFEEAIDFLPDLGFSRYENDHFPLIKILLRDLKSRCVMESGKKVLAHD